MIEYGVIITPQIYVLRTGRSRPGIVSLFSCPLPSSISYCFSPSHLLYRLLSSCSSSQFHLIPHPPCHLLLSPFSSYFSPSPFLPFHTTIVGAAVPIEASPIDAMHSSPFENKSWQQFHSQVFLLKFPPASQATVIPMI